MTKFSGTTFYTYIKGCPFLYYFNTEVFYLSVEISVNGEVTTAYLNGEIDHHSAASIRVAIDNAAELNMPSLLVLDFTRVSFMDSSGIGLVMGRYRNLSRRGAKLHITGTSPQIYKVMKLSGIEKLATIDECKC
ncbi:MAG: anti-sigma factor antagonist [Clostridia bacterium]|nr:anti-sigma factor antagonist [Clostridia bacterium]